VVLKGWVFRDFGVFSDPWPGDDGRNVCIVIIGFIGPHFAVAQQTSDRTMHGQPSLPSYLGVSGFKGMHFCRVL
jgi:hypothetical protein